MKRAFQYLILALWCITFAWANTAPMTLAWDASDGATSYEVWRGTDKLATVTEPQATLQLPTGEHSTLIVIARNDAGQTSSEPLTVQPLRIHHSTDLITWHPGPWFFAPASPRLFARLKHLN